MRWQAAFVRGMMREAASLNLPTRWPGNGCFFIALLAASEPTLCRGRSCQFWHNHVKQYGIAVVKEFLPDIARLISEKRKNGSAASARSNN
jgi:hypothetical protein